jgi:hypothetical protein
MRRLPAATVAVLACSLLIGCQAAPQPTAPTPAPPTTPPPTTSPPATPTSTPPATPAGPSTPAPTPATPIPGEAWQYLADFPAEAAIEVSAVLPRGEGFVAVGFEPAPGEGFGGRRNGVIWRSPDGRSWTRERPASLDNSAPLFIASLNEVLYLFGEYSLCPEFAEEDECDDAPDAGVALWRSTDGREWQRVAVPDAMRDSILDGVTVGPGGLVAYGSTDEDLLGVLFLSPDGENWQEVYDVAAVDPISALGAGPERLMAFGTRYLPDEDDVETLAGYSDGGGFAPGQLPPGQRGVIEAVAFGPAGFVAVGVAFAPIAEGAVALVSQDGQQWSTASDAPTDVGFHQLLVLDGGYLAIGSQAIEGDFGIERGSAWYSPDGLVWVEHGDLPVGEFFQVSTAAVGPGGALVFATLFEEWDEDEPDDELISSIHAWFAPAQALP